MADDSLGLSDISAEHLPDFTRADRFGAILVIALAAVVLIAGVVLRQQSLGQTWRYENREIGIEAQYPANWLVDEGHGYAARFRDPLARPFKTQYQIEIVPAGGQTSIRNVLDGLTIQRSAAFSAYHVLSVEEVPVGGAMLTEMRFTLVDADPNPFTQRLPVVVRGIDIVIRDGDRAIVATYMAAEGIFEANRASFERFLASLRY